MTFGASGENRTPTLLPEPNFESGASTNSATEACCVYVAFLIFRLSDGCKNRLQAAEMPTILSLLQIPFHCWTENFLSPARLPIPPQRLVAYMLRSLFLGFQMDAKTDCKPLKCLPFYLFANSLSLLDGELFESGASTNSATEA